jgi:hypothetical protein
MSDKTLTGDSNVGAVEPPAAPVRALPFWLLFFFAVMVFQAFISVVYAITINRFLADGGYFLAYGSLCSPLSIMQEVDRFAPFVLAAYWLGCIYLGLTRSVLFYRATILAAVISLTYGAIDMVIGPLTFRVGPADVDPSTLTCGRWPNPVRLAATDILQLDWPHWPITVFAISMVFASLTIYVYLRMSRGVRRVYRTA